MAKDPAILFYIDNWLVSTKEMKADERGWYLNLILHQFDKGDLPDDIEELANLADVRFSEFDLFKQKWEQVLKQKFKQTFKGRLINEKANDILRKRELFKDKRSESGKIGYVVKLAINELEATPEQVEYIKTNIDFDSIDTKNKQMLKQVLKQTIKLYINGNINKDNIEIGKDSLKEKEREHIKESEFAIHHKKLEAKKTWRTDFETYLSELNSVYDCLTLNQDFIRQQEEFYPEVDIVLSLKKSYTNFWGTEAGWKHKKKQKSKDIDWKATLTNAIGMNKVYKTKQPVQRKGTSLSQMQQIMDEVNNQKKLIHGI